MDAHGSSLRQRPWSILEVLLLALTDCPTGRKDYELALGLAKQQHPHQRPAGPACLSHVSHRRKRAEGHPAAEIPLAGRFYLWEPAQGTCAYASICEHCPSFHRETSSPPFLVEQRVNADALTRGAEQRG